jgi:hypothetical protein
METIIKQFYSCSICGKTSVNEDKIKECEANHSIIDNDIPVSVCYERNNGRANGYKKYPSDINVTFKNGANVSYCFNYISKETDELQEETTDNPELLEV